MLHSNWKSIFQYMYTLGIVLMLTSWQELSWTRFRLLPNKTFAEKIRIISESFLLKGVSINRHGHSYIGILRICWSELQMSLNMSKSKSTGWNPNWNMIFLELATTSASAEECDIWSSVSPPVSSTALQTWTSLSCKIF